MDTKIFKNLSVIIVLRIILKNNGAKGTVFELYSRFIF